MGFFRSLANVATGSFVTNKIADGLGVGRNSDLRSLPGGPENIILTNQQQDKRNAQEAAANQSASDLAELKYNGSARETNAAITKAQWEDYKARFQPIEDQLVGGLTFDPTTGGQNTQMIAQNVDRAKESASNAFDASSGGVQRNIERIGGAVDPETQSSIQRATSISKAAAMVDAENMTRNRLADRNQEIAMGSIVTSGRNY